MFADLRDRLQVTGIKTKLEDGSLTFQFAAPDGGTLRLARPVPHPWLPEQDGFSPLMFLPLGLCLPVFLLMLTFSLVGMYCTRRRRLRRSLTR